MPIPWQHLLSQLAPVCIRMPRCSLHTAPNKCVSVLVLRFAFLALQVNDLVLLMEVSEEKVCETLEARHKCDLIYTYIGR